MGFNTKNFNRFEKFLETYKIDKENTVVTELGAQQSWIKGGDRKKFYGGLYFAICLAKDFKKINSIDIVREHKGVVKTDLRDLMENTDKYKADIVMNFGTTEHVSSMKGQYHAWVNAHNLCKIGGYILNDVPEKGSFKEHSCCFWYDERFFRGLKGYDILEFERLPHGSFGYTNFVVMKKTGEQFVSYDEFIDLLK